jgi:hypothetical protein
LNALLDAKIHLESELRHPLYRMLIRYVRSVIRAPLTIHEARHHHVSLEGLFLAHYARVVMVVTGRTPNRPQHIEDAVLDIDHLRSLTERARTQAALVLSGLDREIAKATVELKKEGFTSQVLAKARAVMARVRSRIDAIVNAQTNGPAEEVRGREARRAAGNRALYKEWSSMRDTRVRHAHVEAEGQIKLVTEPYIVDGEELMFPGDTSRGASLSNVINCRCASRFYTFDEDGNRIDLAETPRLRPVRPNITIRTITDPSKITIGVPLREGIIQDVFLADMQSARISIRQGVVRVSRGGKRLAIGRFTHGYLRGPRVEGLSFVPGADRLGIQELINRSLVR